MLRLLAVLRLASKETALVCLGGVELRKRRDALIVVAC